MDPRFHYENGKYPLEEDKILAREHIFATWKQLQAIDPHEENTTLVRELEESKLSNNSKFFNNQDFYRSQGEIKSKNNVSGLNSPEIDIQDNENILHDNDIRDKRNIQDNIKTTFDKSIIEPEDYELNKVHETIDLLIKKYEIIFENTLGCLKDYQVDVKLKEGVTPIFLGCRRVPFEWGKEVEIELDRWLKDGIIVPIDYSEWATPLVPIRKSNGKLRLCADFRVTLNPWVVEVKYPLPRIEEILANLKGSKYFSKIDFSTAYLQLPLREDIRKLFTITTSKGLFAFCRLPFGLSVSAPIFQRTMASVFQGLEGVFYYMDDVLITGVTSEQHNQRLEEVFKRIFEKGLKASREKSVLGVKEVVYLGHTIKGLEVRPLDKNLKNIANLQQPKNKSEVQSFLGMVNYYHRFIGEFASIAAPLYYLLKKGIHFEWKESQQMAFELLKQKISEEPILSCFNNDLPIILAVDASNRGVGGALLHVINDMERPILFFSRVFHDAETRYSVIEQEALAVIFGLTKCREYLIGKRFTVYTDHKPLIHLFKKNNKELMLSPRLQRWLLLVGSFNLEIKYRRGRENHLPDILSRLGSNTEIFKINNIESSQEDETIIRNLSHILKGGPTTWDELRKHSIRDKELRQVRLCLIGTIKWKNNLNNYKRIQTELSIVDDCVIRINRAVIPKKLRNKLLIILHAGHQGIERMKQWAREYIWWPGMNEEIEYITKKCVPCNTFANMPHKEVGNIWPKTSRPWERIHVDFFDLNKRSYFLVVDSYSKWIEYEEVHGLTTNIVIKKLQNLWAKFGIPEVIVSDGGPAFISEGFKQFCANTQTQHILAPPYHPSSNGQAERMVAIVKGWLKKAKYERGEVWIAQLYYNNSKNSGGFTPTERFLGRRTKVLLDLIKPKCDIDVLSNKTNGTLYHMGQIVWARCYNNKDKLWERGIVMENLGKKLNRIKFENGTEGIRHHDQTKIRIE
ncbi:unnamed protein product [Gordionus sp. m RMFG-2023]